jgi:hypothetical protein
MGMRGKKSIKILLFTAKLFIYFLRSLQKGFIGKKPIINYIWCSYEQWKIKYRVKQTGEVHGTRAKGQKNPGSNLLE